MRKRVWTSLLTLGVVFGCTDEPPTAADSQVVEQQLVGYCADTNPGFGKFGSDFPCDSEVQVIIDAGASSSERQAVLDAIATLNQSFRYGLPKFVTTPETRSVRVWFNGTGSLYCGSASIGVSTTIERKTTTGSCGDAIVTADLRAVVSHELGRVYGWGHHSDAEPCLMNIPVGGPIHSAFCTLEEQVMYSAYGVRDTVSRYVPLIESVSLTLEGGDATLEAGERRTIRANLVAPGCYGEYQFETDCPPWPDIVWSIGFGSSGIQIVSQTDEVLVVEARDVASNMTVEIRGRARLSPTVVYPEPRASIGFTVVAPPPPPPPAVANIVISPNPVNVDPQGGTQVTATAYDSAGAVLHDVSFTWSVNDPSIAFLAGPGHLCGASQGATRVYVSASGVKRWADVTVPKGPHYCW